MADFTGRGAGRGAGGARRASGRGRGGAGNGRRRGSRLSSSEKIFGRVSESTGVLAYLEAPDEDSEEDGSENYDDFGDFDEDEDEDEDEGLEFREVTVPAGAAELGLTLADDRTGGGFRAVVATVDAGSVFAAAGVQPGDELVTAAGRPASELKACKYVLAAIEGSRGGPRGAALVVFFRPEGFSPLGEGGPGGTSRGNSSGDGDSGGGGGSDAEDGRGLFLEAMSLAGGVGGAAGGAEKPSPATVAAVEAAAADFAATGRAPAKAAAAKAAAGEVSEAVRRGSLAEEGWFALELFDKEVGGRLAAGGYVPLCPARGVKRGLFEWERMFVCVCGGDGREGGGGGGTQIWRKTVCKGPPVF